MPLHEWNDRMGWYRVRLSWLIELLCWIKPRLPTGYRAFIGIPPTIGLAALLERPDVGVRHWKELPSPPVPPNGAVAGTGEMLAPDREVAISLLEPDVAIHVKLEGHLIAAIELISPRNKDLPSARSTYL